MTCPKRYGILNDALFLCYNLCEIRSQVSKRYNVLPKRLSSLLRLHELYCRCFRPVKRKNMAKNLRVTMIK